MDIATHRPEIAFIFHQFAFEATLKEMARTPVSFRKPVGITRQQSLHPTGEVGAWRAEEQMKMIGHQAIREQLPATANDRILQILDESFPIVVVEEDRLPRVATRHDMINRSLVFDAQRSSHVVSITASLALSTKNKV